MQRARGPWGWMGRRDCGCVCHVLLCVLPVFRSGGEKRPEANIIIVQFRLSALSGRYIGLCGFLSFSLERGKSEKARLWS